MRTLHVHEIAIPLSDEAVADLVAAGLIYDCGDENHRHDLHLDPEHEFEIEDVERLALAINRSAARALDA